MKNNNLLHFFSLKGQYHEIFDPVFPVILTHQGPVHMVFISQRCKKTVRGVNETREVKNVVPIFLFIFWGFFNWINSYIFYWYI